MAAGLSDIADDALARPGLGTMPPELLAGAFRDAANDELIGRVRLTVKEERDSRAFVAFANEARLTGTSRLGADSRGILGPASVGNLLRLAGASPYEFATLEIPADLYRFTTKMGIAARHLGTTSVSLRTLLDFMAMRGLFPTFDDPPEQNWQWSMLMETGLPAADLISALRATRHLSIFERWRLLQMLAPITVDDADLFLRDAGDSGHVNPLEFEVDRVQVATQVLGSIRMPVATIMALLVRCPWPAEERGRLLGLLLKRWIGGSVLSISLFMPFFFVDHLWRRDLPLQASTAMQHGARLGVEDAAKLPDRVLVFGTEGVQLDRVLDFVRSATGVPWRDILHKWLDKLRSEPGEQVGQRFDLWPGSWQRLKALLDEFDVPVPRWLASVWADFPE